MNNLKKIMLILLATVMSASLWAQGQKVSGTVTSSSDSKPVAGVEVRLKGAISVSTSTDKNGMFSISVPEESTEVLVFTHEDFDIREIPVAGISSINIELVSNVRYNQYGQKVSRQELSAESRDGYINFESADKKYRLWFDNRIYLDGATYFDNYDYDLSPDDNLALGQVDVPGQLLKLRRMRFAIKVNVGDNWYGEIDFDFDGNTVDIKDVHLRRYFGEAGSYWGALKIGQFRMPQGMQQTTTSRYLKLMERASVAEFNPNRRLGIGWASWSSKYMFAAAVHTEETRNIHDQFEGDPYFFKSPTPDNATTMQGAKPMKGFSSRAAYYVFNEPGKLVSLSGGYSVRTPGLYKYPDDRVKYDPKDETYVSELEFTVAKVGGVKTATNINFDAAVSFGPWRMTGEYYINTLAMKNGSDPVNFNGFYIQSAYLLTGENHPWNQTEAEFTKITANSKKGAWEVAARYSYIDFNDFESSVRGGEKGQYTFGINYYATNNVKFMLNYSFIDHDKYSNGAGDYANFVLESGSGFDYSFLAWRCEIDF